MLTDLPETVFKQRLGNLHNLCYIYYTVSLGQVSGGTRCSGNSRFIQYQYFEKDKTNTEEGDEWIQVYSKSRRAIYAHEDVFLVNKLKFEDVKFVKLSYGSIYIVLKNTSKELLDEL